MGNLKTKIELNIYSTNGNSKIDTPVFVGHFKTVDLNGKHVFSNRGTAIGQLVFFLLNNKVLSVKELIWLGLKYDLGDGKKEFLEKALQEFDK